MSAFRYRDRELECEGTPLLSLAARYGTPLYVYSANAIVKSCNAFKDALAGYDHLLTYAVKANSNLVLLKLIAAQGFGADVGSQGELFLALEAGFSPDTISFSGVGKREDEIVYALERNVRTFDVESEQELEQINAIAARLGTQARVLIRVNLDIEAGTHGYIATARKHDKFGIAPRRALELLQRAQMYPQIDFRGVHSHIGSQITSVEPFADAAGKLGTLVQEFRQQGVPVYEIDFGGGFGIQYEGFVTHPLLENSGHNVPDFASVLKCVLPVLRGTQCQIILQPGRSIVGHAGALLVKVLYRKESDDKNFLVVDGGMNDLLRPSLYQAYHQIVPLVVGAAGSETVDIVGPCCEAGDFFAIDRRIPHVNQGEYLAILCTGAYGYALSSNYNARLRPAEVLVNGANVTVIRQRESLKDLL